MKPVSKMKTSVRAVALALALGTTSYSAHAVLERVGPTDLAPSVGGYPAWYQDTTGVTLEFCDPKNLAEVDGGWCLLLPGDVVAPEVFPTNFFDEHFYFAAVADAPAATGARALLVLAEEAAFAIGSPKAGDQITFSRIRVVLNPVPVTGTYRFIHPYGEDVIEGVAGERIFFTEDIGIGAQGDFSGALSSRLGPWLLPSATPGGAEMPPLTAENPTPDTNPDNFGGAPFAPTAYPGTGKAYIADPARIGPVTGSPLPNFIDSTGASRNHNIFRIEGPAGSALGIDPATGASVDYVETTNFNLMGRIMTGALPSRIEVNRATYARDASGIKLDVFASANQTTQARLPGQPRPASVQPQLSFFEAPCGGVVDALGNVRPPYSAPVGAVEHQMFNAGSSFWGQTNPAAIPAGVCVKDASARDAAGNTVPVFAPRVVADDVLITQSFYDPATGTLTVAASSSDTSLPPTLTLAYGTSRSDLANGQIAVSPLLAPPAKIRVLSSALGANEAQVTTNRGSTPTPTGVPVAANDSYTFSEDSGAQILAILANDSNATGGVVSITTAPRLGAAVVNSNGTVTYTPSLNAFGSDSFGYTVTAGTQVSNAANVALNITPLNDAPTAVNDSANGIVNVVTTVNVLSNDTDPDGRTDLVAATNVTQPAAGASVTVNGGSVSLLATASGTYTFTYQAQDAAGVLSANTATVTVQVAASESLTIAKNEYVRSKSMLKAQGTLTPAAGQTVRLEFVDSTGAVVGSIGTYPTDGVGNWQAQATVALPTGANVLRATTSNNTVRNVAISFK